MRKLPTFPHLATTVAVIGLAALFGTASGSGDDARILLKSPALAAAEGEAAASPVDLDGDGIDDSAAFAAALAAEMDEIGAPHDAAPVPKSKPRKTDQVVVLRAVPLPCATTVAHGTVPDLDAPVKRLSETTPWVLLAGADDAPNAKGKELRVLGQPVLAKSTGRNRVLVVEPGETAAPEGAIPVSTLPKGCAAEPTVS